MVKKYFIILFGSTSLATGWIGDCPAQTSKERYLRFLPGYAYQDGRDVGMSPLVYTGNNFTGVFGFEKRTAKNINRIDASTVLGRMVPTSLAKDIRSHVKVYRVQLDYSYLHLAKKWKEDALRIYAGGVWNTLANARYHTTYVNNAWNYEFSSSLGGTATLSYNFKLRKASFLLHTCIELPIVGFNIRPAYGSSIPEGFIAKDGGNVKAFFKSGDVQTFNRFFRIRALHTLEYILVNGNRLMMNYTWDYYSMVKYHKVQMASHQLLLGWAFSF